MKRGLVSSVKYLILAGALYLLAYSGDFAAGGPSGLLSINAFLFLVGLGGVYALLSPPPASFRAQPRRPLLLLNLRPRRQRLARTFAYRPKPAVLLPSGMILLRPR